MATTSKAKKVTEERTYDLVVYGATSFVGKIVARHLHERHGTERRNAEQLRWAIAGRDAGKLEALKRELGAPDLPVLLADAADPAALRTLVSQTRVIASTVGPYALYGSELVAACVKRGTDYCDLTGEVPWMHRMIGAHETTAKQSGARIVHTCGFDSVPSDLGVWFLQRQAQEHLGEPCIQIKLRVKTFRGGGSGGTIASLGNVIKEAADNPAMRAVVKNPYALVSDQPASGVPQAEMLLPVFDDAAEAWVAHFLMGSINSRVIHRSHALRGLPWGDQFRYDEAMVMGRGLWGRLKAFGMTAGLGSFAGLTALTPTRPLMAFLSPKPGTGPSPESQARGCYDFRLYGQTASGKKIQVRITGDRDPGYGSTAKILGEAAVCLARDIDRQQAGGFWTPSTVMAEPLFKRLVSHAGLTFETLST